MSDAAFAAAVRAALNEMDPAIQGSRVTVALSGGADSVALCHFLATHAAEWNITVAAAHLNHGLRGEESDRDEAFVRDLCRQLGLQLTCEKLAYRTDTSEAALRKQRYAFLWQAAGEGFLATGHTLTDSCETLLFHLARGTRLGGMRGIPQQTGRLIRPLLAVCRTDTEAYCREHGLCYVTDSSNLSDAYARNRLRHGAMPALCSVNPRAQQAMAAWMQEAGELYNWLDVQAKQLINQAQLPSGGWRADVLAAAPDVVLRHALTVLLAPYGDCSAQRIALAVRVVCEGGAVEWCAGVRFCNEAGRLRVAMPADAQADNTPTAFCCPAKPGIYHPMPGLTVEIRQYQCTLQSKNASVHNLDDKTRKINKKDLNNRLDYAKISSMCILTSDEDEKDPHGCENTPVLRFRAPGDRFAPGRGRGTKSLKKWFNEIACPPAERGHLPLIAVGSKVLWLAGSGAAQDCAATEDSDTVWEILWKRSNAEGSL